MKKRFVSTSLVLILAMLITILPTQPTMSIIPKAAASSGDSAMAYRCGDVTGDGNIKVNDAVDIFMFLAKMSSTSIKQSNPSALRASLITAASRGQQTTYADSDLTGLSPAVRDAVDIFMFLAKMKSSRLNACSLSGCDWCIEAPGNCPECKSEDCPINQGASAPTAQLPKANGEGVTADFRNLTAKETVYEIRAGWNLGNSFDAHTEKFIEGGEPIPYGNAGYGLNSSLSTLETLWQPITSLSLIKKVKELGFDTIRIPTTWYKMADPYNDWTFGLSNDGKSYIERVKTVVEWALAEDMYVILNTHHEESVMLLFDEDIEQSKKVVERMWEQIAEEFKDCSEKLIFEGINEPRTKGTPGEWMGGTKEERDNINILSQVFVDTVRASGGNNAYRVLMLPTYAASAEAVALNGFVVPEDTDFNTTDGVSHKIALSIHSYTPGNFCKPGTTTIFQPGGGITIPLNRVKDKANALGIPAVLGEWGSVNKSNTDERAAHAEFYVQYARDNGMKCVYWDNGRITPATTIGSRESFGLINRQSPYNILIDGSFQPIIEAIMKASACKPLEVVTPAS